MLKITEWVVNFIEKSIFNFSQDSLNKQTKVILG